MTDPLLVTTLTAIVLAVALVALSLPVSLRRMATGIEAGHGDDEILRRRVRAQGNFIEYAPLGLLVLLLAETRGAAAVLVWALAAMLVAGRALHAAGMLLGQTSLRAPGMLLTHGAFALGAVALAVSLL